MGLTKHNEKEFAKFQAENLMKQLQESVQIVNTTSNAIAFFSRLKFSLEVLSELKKYEKYHFFKTSTPTNDYNKIISNLEATVDNFIDRAIEAIKRKLDAYKTDAAKSRNYKKFLEDLLDDFEMADTFWSGNNMYPPYKGILYTSANYQRVKKMYDDFLALDVAKNTQTVNNNVVYQNVQNDSFAKFGGVDAELMTIDLMEGHDFEYWCAGLLRKIGFSRVEVTPGSNDQGVDILAQKDGVKYAIQCKRYSHDLGNTPVQEVHAGKAMYNCHVGVVLTNQHFTTGAKQLAQATGVLLWDRVWIKTHLETTQSDSSCESAALDDPELFTAAVDAVLETGQASISMLQRRLKLGYARAARLVDEMEEKGIVGPFQGSKPRTILITKEEWDIRAGKRIPAETPHKVQSKVTPDLDPVSDYRPSDVMVEIPEPEKKPIFKFNSGRTEREIERPSPTKKLFLVFFSWVDTFLLIIAFSMFQSEISDAVAIASFIAPALVGFFIAINKKNKKFFANCFSFWILMLFIVFYIMSIAATK